MKKKASKKGRGTPAGGDGAFLNRELSWLAFNRRVLQEARDDRTPLLERLRFLAIFTRNLDEFFMKRVGGLKGQVSARVAALSIDGLSPARQLDAIRACVTPMLESQASTFARSIRPALTEAGVHLLSWAELTDEERLFAQHYFQENVFPVLTPMAVDPGHPFPFLSNLSVSLGVRLKGSDAEESLFARVKVPETLPGWVRLGGEDAAGAGRFVSLVAVISHNLAALFPGMQLLTVTPFRITRNADIARDEEDVEDLLELIEQELRERRFERVVRLEHGPDADPWTLQFLMAELELSSADVFEMSGLLDYRDLEQIAVVELPPLRYPPWVPVVPLRLRNDEADVFSVIRAGDLLVHHPFESFTDSVERFIIAATEDPKVLAIKLTLYRIGDTPRFIESLISAAESGKQVVCLVELKARFDEQRNIFWAHQLERAGVHVVYGIVGLKTHTKMVVVVRRDADRLRTYVHLGTGNYNPQTAKVFSDFGLMTCGARITAEAVELFNYLTGRSRKDSYDHLLVAPVNMRARFTELIEQESANAKAGKPARIVAQMNSLEDTRIIRALYEASQAGVKIDLIIRGFCCLRPGVKGLSERIRVISVIGRFLEHARVFYFRSEAEEEVDGRFYFGSADWMFRNLDRRVEVVTPIEDPQCRTRIWAVLQTLLADRRQAWDLQPDGEYVQRQPTDPASQVGSHERFLAWSLQAIGRT